MSQATECPILTKAELIEITGKVRKTAQERVLLALGFNLRKRPDGTIVILRSEIHAPTKAQHRTPSLRLP